MTAGNLSRPDVGVYIKTSPLRIRQEAVALMQSKEHNEIFSIVAEYSCVSCSVPNIC